MSESVPAAGVALNDPFAVLTGPLAATTRMQLEVVDSRPLSPGMQRLVLTAPELAGLQYRPGQDMMLMVAVDGDRPVRRRYTIRARDAGGRLLTLDVVRHGDGPGERWVAAARPGARIEGIGPRGKIFLAAADWHLFIGDDSALPAFFAMAGALPAGARALVILEVPGPGGEQELVTAADAAVTWLHAGWPRSRSRPRRTGAAAGRTPNTASPPRTSNARTPGCRPAAPGMLPGGTRDPGRGSAAAAGAAAAATAGRAGRGLPAGRG